MKGAATEERRCRGLEPSVTNSMRGRSRWDGRPTRRASGAAQRSSRALMQWFAHVVRSVQKLKANPRSTATYSSSISVVTVPISRSLESRL